MAEGQVSCAICKLRRPRRRCPGISGNICTVCCGTERENTIHCPLDCEYLLQAHAWEKETPIEPSQLPHPEIRIDEAFLSKNEPLLLYIGAGIAKTALEIANAVDSDIREALAATVQSYVTLQSGLVYEVRPDNPIAARIQARLRKDIQDVEASLQAENASLRDSDVLGILVFLQRVELQRNNGRRYGRAFLEFLFQMLPFDDPDQKETSLIIP